MLIVKLTKGFDTPRKLRLMYRNMRPWNPSLQVFSLRLPLPVKCKWQYLKWHALLHMRRSIYALDSSSSISEKNNIIQCIVHSVKP